MFDFLRKAVRAARNEGKPELRQEAATPAGLRLGGFVSVDTLPFKMQAGQLAFTAPEGMQKIEAYGRADLGAAAELHRYYLSDDSWLQVNTTADSIADIKLWTFADTKNPATRADFDRWLERGSEIGGSTATFAGYHYRRVWGEGAEWAPPVHFAERVYTRPGDIPEYTTEHHCMLYEREVEGGRRMEYLFISAELTGEDYSVVYSVGVDITLADLSIT